MSDDTAKNDGTVEPPTCQVCGTPIADGLAVYCADCGTPHHQDCWTYNRTCSTFGCDGVAFSDTPPARSTATVVVDENTPAPAGYDARALVTRGDGPNTWLGRLRRIPFGRPPYGGDDFISPLPPTKLALRLREQVEQSNATNWLTQRSDKAFIGSVDEEGFEIVPTIRYRNSFVPVIRGRFVATEEGTRIKISMRPYWFVVAFMSLWLGGVTAGLVGGVTTVVAGGGLLVALPFCVIPLVMLTFGWLMLSGGFWYEATPALEKIRALLAGKTSS